jgi:hypothetical protein
MDMIVGLPGLPFKMPSPGAYHGPKRSPTGTITPTVTPRSLIESRPGFVNI